ncbi:MAG TPA: hypothetical protein V6C81_00950 [Planktothrix sp.]|jgi:hypothetical protein
MYKSLPIALAAIFVALSAPIVSAEELAMRPPSAKIPSVAPDTAESTCAVDPDNPRVVPGLVKWHSSFDEAKKASASSGKPILLFEMLGNLDDKFC